MHRHVPAEFPERGRQRDLAAVAAVAGISRVLIESEWRGVIVIVLVHVESSLIILLF